MIEKRIGNDFVLTWIINRDGLPFDFTGAFDEQVQLVHFGSKKEIPFRRTGNNIRVEITPEMAPTSGVYSLHYFFKLTDPAFRNGYRNRCIDEDVVKLISETAPGDAGDFEVITNLITNTHED